MSTNCKSCGKLMTKPEDFSGGDISSQYCSNCTNADGSLKSLDEITLHIANQLIMSQGIDREAATKAARSILSMQPEWKKLIQSHDQRGYRRQRLVLIGVSIILCVSLVVSLFYFSGKNSAKNPYNWTEEGITGQKLFVDVKPNISSQNYDSVKVTRVSFPNNQYNPKIDNDSNEIYFFDQAHNASGYKLYWIGESVNGIDLGRVGNDFHFIGSACQDWGRNCIYYYTVLSQNLQAWEIYASKDFARDSAQKLGNIFSPNDVVLCGNYLVWISFEPSNPLENQIYAFNPQTWKRMEIGEKSSSKLNIVAGKNIVYWSDSGDSEKQGYTIKGYNFLTKKIIDTGLISNNIGVAIDESLTKENEWQESKTGVWFVSGDNIAYQNFQDGGEFLLFSAETGKVVEGTTPDISYNRHKRAFPWESVPVIYVGYSNSLTVSDNYAVWLSDTGNDKKRYVSWTTVDQLGKKKDNKVRLDGFSTEFTDFLTINGNWLVWVASDTTINSSWGRHSNKDAANADSNYKLYATNLDSGKQLSLGTYNFDGFEKISVQSSKSGLIAWSAWTEDAGYDIFYTRLP